MVEHSIIAHSYDDKNNKNVLCNKNKIYSIKNILGNQKKNNEVYTPIYLVEELINDVIKLPKNLKIWCPFDKEDSAFVKILRKKGYNVIHSHIDDEQKHDFYAWQPEEKWDLIISNPPFSKKRLLIERCESFKKPFCLLYGATICSQSMGNTLNRCCFWFIQKNVKFTTSSNTKKSFQCLWLFNKGFKYLKNK